MALPNKTKIPVGTVLAGKYRITREIGRGGMATVHEAENVDIGKRVAIKVLAQELTGSSIVVERFLREARAAAAIRSPYICDVYDSGKLSSGQPFLVLELLEGESLYERMTRQRQLDAPTTIAVITQVCRGLTKAHAASIVHRDLKPENIFLTRDEEGQLLAKILDFGLAKFYTPTTKDQARLTREGAVFGTPAYMSPEQVRGQGAVDHRADLWALGCITYECFTGKTVWSTDQGVAMTFAQIASAPLPRPARYRPDLPVTFTEWFDRTLDRDINKRFQTAKEFAEALSASFGMERRESSEIKASPISARDEAISALVNAPTERPAPPPPAQQAAPPSSGRAPRDAAPASGPAPQSGPVGAEAFRPISEEEDGDPTRVLAKRPLVKPLDANARTSQPDGRLERFKRGADGKILKVVPQVAPNAPPVPLGMRPPSPAPAAVAMTPQAAPNPVAHAGAAPVSTRHPGAPQPPAPPRPRPQHLPTGNDHDSEIDKNPFVKARRRRRLAIVLTLLVLAVLVVVFAITSSGSGSGDDASGATTTSTAAAIDSSAAPVRTGSTPGTNGAGSSAAPDRPEPAMPAWMPLVREAQAALAAGDAKGAAAKLDQAGQQSAQSSAVQGLARHVATAVWAKGTCSLAGVARPRTYDLASPGAKRVAATKPAIVASAGGALAAWTDAHDGPSHAYVARLDSSLATTSAARDVTPDGVEVRAVDLVAWGDSVVLLYNEAKGASPGTFARRLGADGKPLGDAVRVGPAKNTATSPTALGAPGQSLFVAWVDDGDRDSEDLFLQKLSATTLEPEGAPKRVTDLIASGAPHVRAVGPRGAFVKDALRLVFELERKPGSFIEMQTIPPGDVGRDLATTGTNREGKAVGALTLVNVDKSRAHAPQIACSPEMCFVVWHGESPPGAQGAAFDLSTGRNLWRRKFSPNALYPAVAAAPGGGVAAWIESGALVASPLGKAGFGRFGKVGRASASQPVLSLAPAAEKGQFLAAWLDMEATLPEPYVARIKCP
ncbi:MAG: serine/threonine-protein kinase [Polyangiaceae bacterium]